VRILNTRVRDPKVEKDEGPEAKALPIILIVVEGLD